MSSWPPRCPAEPNGPTRRVGAPRRVEVGDDVPSSTGRSAAARPSSAELCGLRTAPDGEPNISTAVCSLGSGVPARTANQ